MGLKGISAIDREVTPHHAASLTSMRWSSMMVIPQTR